MRCLQAVAILLICAGNVRGGDWVDGFTYGPFVCRAEFSVSADGSLPNELMQLKDDVEQAVGIRIGNQPIELNLFRSRRNYVAHVARYVPEGVNRRALFVQGADGGRLYAYYSSQFRTDVRHECTHALLHSALRFLPVWMDEGLAEYFEEPPELRRLPERARSARFKSHFGWSPSLTRLEGKSGIHDMGTKDYANAWAWIHFLLHESPQTRETLIAYIDRIEAEDPPGPFSRFLDERIPRAESRFSRHFRRFTPR